MWTSNRLYQIKGWKPLLESKCATPQENAASDARNRSVNGWNTYEDLAAEDEKTAIAGFKRKHPTIIADSIVCRLYSNESF